MRGAWWSGFKGGNVNFAADYEEQLAFEGRWVNALMSKGALPIPKNCRQGRPDPNLAAEPEMPQLSVGSTKRRKFKFKASSTKRTISRASRKPAASWS